MLISKNIFEGFILVLTFACLTLNVLCVKITICIRFTRRLKCNVFVIITAIVCSPACGVQGTCTANGPDTCTCTAGWEGPTCDTGMYLP
jgi:hypothetical protein